jgi:F0F1-type ATP synthase assembly protein I
MERIFQILAVILAGVAAYFLWAGNNDRAFVSAVLGSVSFFLSVRFQVKERNRIRELEKEKEQQIVDSEH